MTISNKQARIHVSPELLRQVLQLPDGTEIFGASWDFYTGGCIELFVTHPDFPDLEEGQSVPVVNVFLSCIAGETIPKVRVSMDLPKKEPPEIDRAIEDYETKVFKTDGQVIKIQVQRDGRHVYKTVDGVQKTVKEYRFLSE